MNRKKPLVVVTRRLPDVVETRMRELFDARLNVEDRPMTPAELIEAVQTADVLVPTVTDEIDASLLAKAGERLKLIANFGNGVDNIDVQTALSRGITVTNTPGVLTEDTADMTMALILAVARRIAEGSRVIPDETWNGWSPTWMLGHRVSGKRLGIVGMGRIGQAVARRARAFQMSIHYHNRRRVSEEIEQAARACVAPLKQECVDTVILGCTHYPLITPMLRRLLGPQVSLINSAEETAREVGEILSRKGIANELGREGAYSFYASGDPEEFREIGARFLQLPIREVGRL
jgi:glyoxylate reductase